MKKKIRTYTAQKIDSFFLYWAHFSIKHYFWILLITLALTIVMGFHATHLRLESDFEAMLPENYQSVKDLRRYQNEIGTTSTLSIALMTANIEAAKKFSDDLVAVINSDLKDKVHHTEHKITQIRNFFKTNALLYVDKKDLEKEFSILREYFDRKKLEASGLYIDINEDQKETNPFSNIKELLTTYASSASKQYGIREDGYYINDAQNLLVVLVYPQTQFVGVKNAKILVQEINDIIQSLHPKNYDPSLEYGFAGPVQIAVNEYETIRKDIVGTLALCIILVLTVLFLYFLRLRFIILIILPLCIGFIITLGITELFIGYLNAQTAFLGSIIIGTGINYGIMLLARYKEERAKENNFEHALVTSTRSMWRATFIAAFGTAVSFLALSFSENLSFKQFGFIAGIGIMLIWLISVLVLPAMIVLSERISPLIKSQKKSFEIPFIHPKFAHYIINHSRYIIIVSSVITIISFFLIFRWLPHALEYDFSKLRNKMTFNAGTEELDHRIVHEVIKRSTTPVIALTEDIEGATAYCDSIQKKISEKPHIYAAGECTTLMSFLPTDQKDKIVLLKKIDSLLEAKRTFIPKKYTSYYNEYKKMFRIHSLDVKDIPSLIKNKFTHENKELGVAVVKPVPGKNIWMYDNLNQFVNTVRSVDIGNGKIITASGAPIIYYDLVQTVAHDAPRATIYAIIGVLLVLIFIAGNTYYAFATIFTLIVGIATMIGIAICFGIKINFFNFIAIPTAFGTGVDYGINILMRYISQNKNDTKDHRKKILHEAMVKTGGAVFLCSATTIIGYFSLIYAHNQALVSYGQLAIAGEIGCLLTAVVLLPALLLKKN